MKKHKIKKGQTPFNFNKEEKEFRDVIEKELLKSDIY